MTTPRSEIETLEADFLRRCQGAQIFNPGDTILLLLSGGVDSTALFHLFIRHQGILGIRLAALHLNYGLRGAESQGNADFISTLCAHYQIEVHHEYIDDKTLLLKGKGGLQAEARALRYGHAKMLCEKWGYRYVATGHHAEDQAETVLWRALKGSGLGGLKAMEPFGSWLIRPLLSYSKAQLVAYLQAQALAHSPDSSNASEKYERNRLRNSILPLVRASINAQADKALCQLAERARLDDDFIHAEVDRRLADAKSGYDTDGVDLPWLLRQPEAILRRVILRLWQGANPDQGRQMAHHLDGFSAALKAGLQGGSLPGGVGWAVDGNRLCVRRPIKRGILEAEEALLAMPGLTSLKRAGIVLEVRGPSPVPKRSHWRGPNNRCLMDMHRLSGPLRVRYFQPGDRFHPLGAPGRQKLSDFFINQKIAPEKRPLIPLVLSGETILWVVGYRSAETAKLGDSSINMIEIIAHETLGDEQ